MSSGTRGGEVRPGSLGFAALTLLVPLITIVVAALGRPAPAPVAPAPARAAIGSPLIETAPPLPPPPQIIPPPPAPTPQVLNPLPRWSREDNLSFLLLGIDRRSDDEIYRTDTIIVANLDLRAQRASLLSIPRDLVVTIPGYGQDRVNTAFAIGETQRAGRGLPLLRDTIERNLGITLNHYP